MVGEAWGIDASWFSALTEKDTAEKNTDKLDLHQFVYQILEITDYNLEKAKNYILSLRKQYPDLRDIREVFKQADYDIKLRASFSDIKTKKE